MKICIINGPNINFTGIREQGVYGTKTYTQMMADVKEKIKQQKIEVAEIFQSNYEGAIIDKLQSCYFEKIDGIVINPGAFTHYSYAIKDAISSVNIPTIEVHISNIHKRDEFRHKSVTASSCVGQMCGFGENGYVLAAMALKMQLEG